MDSMSAVELGAYDIEQPWSTSNVIKYWMEQDSDRQFMQHISRFWSQINLA